MKKASAPQLQELDRIAREDFKIKSLVLMENAGFSVAKIVVKTLKQTHRQRVYPHTKGFSVGVNVVCGKGNNGADGFVCARHLINQGVKTNVFLIGGVRQLKNDALVNYNLFKEKQDINEIKDLVEFKKSKDILADCDLFVDAIFGIGLKGEIKEPFKSVIKFLNNTAKPIISVDVPSGLDATTGECLGECIKATKTVTFNLAKKGFFINQGPVHCGKIIVVDIGIPKKIINRYVE